MPGQGPLPEGEYGRHSRTVVVPSWPCGWYASGIGVGVGASGGVGPGVQSPQTVGSGVAVGEIVGVTVHVGVGVGVPCAFTTGVALMPTSTNSKQPAVVKRDTLPCLRILTQRLGCAGVIECIAGVPVLELMFTVVEYLSAKRKQMRECVGG